MGNDKAILAGIHVPAQTIAGMTFFRSYVFQDQKNIGNQTR
jgi:hypothetical protein